VSRRGLLLFAAMCVIWGIPYLLIRVAVAEVSPAVLVFIRTAVATVILLPFVLSGGGLRPIGHKWPYLLAFAGVEVAAPWFFLSSAEQQITSALAGLLVAAVPLAGVIIAAGFGNREYFGAGTMTGLLLGLVGVALIVGFDLPASSPLALAEMAGVVVGYALGPAILSRFLTGIPSVTVIGVALAACCVAYTPFAIAQWPHAALSLAALGSISVLAVLCTAVAFLLFFELIAQIGPVRSTVITYVNPAVAAVLGVTVLHESFTLGMGAGFALVLLGSVLSTRRGTAPEDPRTAPERQPGQAV
jgi:drug/metabolite transporter (DMT)-like permease